MNATIDIAANLATVRSRIAEAAQRSRRSVDEITLVAVSKTHPVELVLQALDRKSTRLNSSHVKRSRMPSSA